jgi:hypothetical protein
MILGLLLVSAALAVDVTITWDKWPYGVRHIGSYFKWWMSADAGHVTVPEFNSDDTIWDLVNIGGSAVNRNAESYIRPKTEAQGSPPGICTYAEKQVFNGQTSWGYEHMDTSGGIQYMWLYGFYTQGQQIDYESPYNQVYRFPMQLGDNWYNEWQWNYQGMDIVYETRNNYVVAEGWARVPADSLHYYPCLVIRTYSTSIDELGAINENRIIHEWVVPDMGLVGGSVATVQSQNNPPGPGFTDAEHVFRMKQFFSVFDNQPPTFVNTTRIPSGYNLGPFPVSSQITDRNGVRKDSIYYKIGSALWQVAGRDSMRNNKYHFHIPQLSGADSVWYYLAASDTAPSRNRGTDPAGAPGNTFSFFARNPADDHFPPAITGTTQWADTAFTGPFVVMANVVDSCSVDSVKLLYRFNTAPEQPVTPDSVRGSDYYMAIPSAALNTFIRYRIKARDGSPNHNTGYDPPSGFYSFNVIDALGPAITNTTVWNDTTYPGPFLVQSRVTDVSGVQRAAIFFKLGSGSWDSLPSDSTRDSTYSMHVPEVLTPMSVRYYVKAVDNSQRHNVATDPANAPSQNYLFFCDPQVGISDRSGLPAGCVLDLKSVNPAQLVLTTTCPGRLAVTLYDVKGSRVASLGAGLRPAGDWRFALPARLTNGNYLAEVCFAGGILHRNFVISR